MSEKKVLVLCQANEPIVREKLMKISKEVLQDVNIKLEFMSNPMENPSKYNDKNQPYSVNYTMYFNEKDKISEFIQNHLNYYSLIIMNTCPFPYSPNLKSEKILNNFKLILKKKGFLIISILRHSNFNYNKKKISIILKNKIINAIFNKYFKEIPIENNDIILLFKNNNLNDLNDLNNLNNLNDLKNLIERKKIFRSIINKIIKKESKKESKKSIENPLLIKCTKRSKFKESS